ncbi:hypothetical protein [Microseira sp. BLCC-F43]|jgi:hypothetical protein|uniref:hypothetical protein n=1 Tax=Microseira sp. BLCC-F43 TaxID=3153602 RepID=UPI0035BB369E
MMSAKSPIIKTHRVTALPCHRVIPNYGYSSGHDITRKFPVSTKNRWFGNQRATVQTRFLTTPLRKSCPLYFPITPVLFK